jgi:hypothetical protein
MMAWGLLTVGETFAATYAGEKLESQAAAGTDSVSDSLKMSQVQIGTDTVSVIHFHPTVQCSCCINVGSFSKEALEKHYAAPFENGLIVFRECNIDQDTLTPARYGIFGSALGFSRMSDGKEEFEDIQSVWDFCEDHDKFLSAFRKELDDFLKGPKADTSETARPDQRIE